MRLTFVTLLLFFITPVLAEKSPHSILDSLFGKCMNDSSNICESILVGDTEKKHMVLSLLNVMRTGIVFEKSYVKAYGKEKYAELIDAYSLTISPIKSSDYHLQSTNENSATFQGPDSTVLSILNTQNGWVIDLESSSFSGFRESDNRDMLEFVSLIGGSQSLLIKLIKSNAPEKDVFKKGGLYYLASIYSLVADDQKTQLDGVFKEYDSDVVSVKKEIITEVNN